MEREAYRQMGARFCCRPTVRTEILGGLRLALEFQQIILGMLSAAKNAKGPIGYSGIEAGFLLAVGELSRGAIHVQTLSEVSHASERRTRRMDVTAPSRYTPNEWEFGVSHSR